MFLTHFNILSLNLCVFFKPVVYKPHIGHIRVYKLFGKWLRHSIS